MQKDSKEFMHTHFENFVETADGLGLNDAHLVVLFLRSIEHDSLWYRLLVKKQLRTIEELRTAIHEEVTKQTLLKTNRSRSPTKHKDNSKFEKSERPVKPRSNDRDHRDHSKGKGRRDDSSRSPSRDSRDVECRRCHRTGHIERNCRVNTSIDGKALPPRESKDSRNSSYSRDKGSSKEKSMSLSSLHTTATSLSRLIFVSVEINGKKREALLDSGASHNFVAVEEVTNALEKPPGWTVSTAGRAKLPVLATLSGNVKLLGKVVENQSFKIIKGLQPRVILGMPFLVEANLDINWITRDIRFRTSEESRPKENPIQGHKVTFETPKGKVLSRGGDGTEGKVCEKPIEKPKDSATPKKGRGPRGRHRKVETIKAPSKSSANQSEISCDRDVERIQEKGAVLATQSSKLDPPQYHLDRDILHRALRQLGVEKLSVDLFASRNNRQTKVYYSRVEEPEAAGTDAFAFNWSQWNSSQDDEAPYANPPWELIPRMLEKCKIEGVRMVVVVPVWHSAEWWPLFESLQVKGVTLPAEPLFISKGREKLPAPSWQTRVAILHPEVSCHFLSFEEIVQDIDNLEPVGFLRLCAIEEDNRDYLGKPDQSAKVEVPPELTKFADVFEERD